MFPDGVTLADHGEHVFISERGYFAPPNTACMFASLAILLVNGGYRLPLPMKKADTPPENFVRTLQLAGDPTPKNGSTMRQSQTALRKLLPDAPVLFGAMTLTEIVAELVKETAIRLNVNCAKLPQGELKRWVGGAYKGGHALVTDAVRISETGDIELFWKDTMGKAWTGYGGEWVPLGRVLPALRRRRTDPSKIIVTIMRKDAAVKGVA